MILHVYRPRCYAGPITRLEESPNDKRKRRWCPMCNSLQPLGTFWRQRLSYLYHEGHISVFCEKCREKDRHTKPNEETFDAWLSKMLEEE